MKTFLDLAIAFARVGVIGYGGGPSFIPLVRYEAVEKYRWMKDEEFGEILALANALPGPIATKMAAYIGFKVRGTFGAFTAVLAHILPTVIAIIMLLGFLYSLKDSPVVSGMIQAVAPVIGVMLLVMAFEFFQKSRKGLGVWFAVSLLLASLVTIEWLGIHPGIVIIVVLAASFLLGTQRARKIKLKKRETTGEDVES